MQSLGQNFEFVLQAKENQLQQIQLMIHSISKVSKTQMYPHTNHHQEKHPTTKQPKIKHQTTKHLMLNPQQIPNQLKPLEQPQLFHQLNKQQPQPFHQLTKPAQNQILMKWQHRNQRWKFLVNYS